MFRDNPAAIDRALKNLSDRISALEDGLGTDESGDNDTDALRRLRFRLSALELKAVAGFRKGDDSLWYAYNKDGQDVEGPFDFGSGLGVMTLAELLDSADNDSVTYRDPTPITATEIGPNITLSGLLNAVNDDSVTYQEPTPIVNE